MRDTKRGEIYLLSDTLGKVVAVLWNSLFADAVTPHIRCFWGCFAVPNGLRLHSTWWHPIPVLSQREQMQDDKIQKTCRYQSPYINSDFLAFRLLPMLILLVLGCVSENCTLRTLRDA